MPRVLVIHGAGMSMRGTVQLDIFDPMTLPEYDQHIRGHAKELGVASEIYHSNIECEIVDKLYATASQSIVAGFGVAGYALALRGIRDRLDTKA
jgi:3-dehydroquinate dehydratase-2